VVAVGGGGVGGFVVVVVVAPVMVVPFSLGSDGGATWERSFSDDGCSTDEPSDEDFESLEESFPASLSLSRSSFFLEMDNFRVRVDDSLPEDSLPESLSESLVFRDVDSFRESVGFLSVGLLGSFVNFLSVGGLRC